MAFPVQLLLTPADCDLALADLNLELRTFTVQDSVLDLRSDKATQSATDRATELGNLASTIATLTPIVASLPASSAARRLNERELTRATRRQQDLNLPQAASNPVSAFLKAVDLRQVAVQVPELQQAIAEVTTHRATL